MCTASLDHHPRVPSRTPPRRTSQLAGESPQVTAQLFFLWSPGVATGLKMEGAARRVLSPGEWPPELLKLLAGDKAWQVTRIDLWKELPLGSSGNIVQWGFKDPRVPEFELVCLQPTRQIRRPWGLESLQTLGAPSPLRAKEVKFLAAGDPLHNDEPEAVCAPRCTTCIRPSTSSL